MKFSDSKIRKGLELGPGLGLEDTNERPGGSVDQRAIADVQIGL